MAVKNHSSLTLAPLIWILISQRDNILLKHYVAYQVWLVTRKPSKGQSLAEYGLILALIAVVCIGALTTLGGNLKAKLAYISGQIGGA